MEELFAVNGKIRVDKRNVRVRIKPIETVGNW